MRVALRRIAIFLLALTAVAVGPFFMLWLGGWAVQQVHAPVTESSLARAVAVEADSVFYDHNSCSERGGGRWLCEVSDTGGSGVNFYNVAVRRDSSCWTASLKMSAGDGPAKRTMSGCVNHFEGGWWGLIFGITPIPSRP